MKQQDGVEVGAKPASPLNGESPAGADHSQLTVLVVGGQSVSVLGVGRLLETDPRLQVATAVTESHLDAIRKIRGLKPDVLVTDLYKESAMRHFPEVLDAIKEHSPATNVVVVTHIVEAHAARQAVRAGSLSYVLKEEGADVLMQAVSEAAAGRQYMSPKVALDVVHLSLKEETEVLSPRELEVLTLVARGHTNSEIAEILFLSVRTIEAYRGQIHSKLGVDRRWEMYKAADDRGLLDHRAVEEQ
jgi:DNA-binding NarL/FixJ family response regulator